MRTIQRLHTALLILGKILTRVKKHARMLIIGSIIAGYQSIVSRRSKLRFKRLSPAEKNKIIEALSTPSLKNQNPVISFVGASRKLQNPNNKLLSFLKSVVKNTSMLERVEVLVRIDDDDDFLYYYKIREKIGHQLCLRFVIGERGNGYKGLHVLVSDLLNYLSPSSKIVFGYADDCIITRAAWDNNFVETITQYPDNLFFINTLRDNYRIPYTDPLQFFWLLWAGGPPAIFPALGRRVLEIAGEIAKQHLGWTPFGNSVMCDSFFEALQMYMWKAVGNSRTVLIPNTIQMRTDVAIASHKEGGLFSKSPIAYYSYKEFLTENTQCIIKSIAAAICKNLSPSSESPCC